MAEPGLFDKITSGVTGALGKVKDTITGTAQKMAAPVQSALPSVATDDGATKMLGGAKEPSGMTITGGRRYRKKTSKRHSKKHKKTLRRKH